MPTTKLTLSADRELVERAKKLAAENSTSLSSMFARLLHVVLRERERTEPPGPLTREATGLVSLPTPKSDAELIEEALADKYGV